MKRITAQAMVLAVSVGWVSATALAATENSQNQNANMHPITVQAHHGVQKRQVGLSYTGIPIEQVSLSREVGYGDLDLSTPQGKAKLERRIKTVAREACGQLHKLYPLDSWDSDNRSCVADAIGEAMNQVKTIVADTSQH